MGIFGKNLSIVDAIRGASLAGLVVGMSACGGGGGGGGSPPINAVTASANAGTDQRVSEEGVVQLTGSGSASNGGAVTYSWSQISGPTVTLSDTTVASPSFTAPSVQIGFPANLVFRLTVNGPEGSSDRDDVTVTVGAREQLYFRAFGPGTGNQTHLYRFDLASEATTRLSGSLVMFGAVNEFKVSPDGQFVAYVADAEVENQFELYVVPADGGTVVKANPPLVANGDVVSFEWAPNGTLLLFNADVAVDQAREVFIFDAATGVRTRVNSDQLVANGGNATLARWSPDGQWVSYFVLDPALSPAIGTMIHDVDLPGQADVQLTADPSLVTINSQGEFIWAPDSSGGYFAVLLGGGGQVPELYSINVDGSSLTNLGAQAGFSYVLSPDGQYLATVADHDQDGEASVWTVRTDGTGSNRVVLSSAPNSTVGTLAWAPDSSRLAFRAQDGSQPRRLYTVLPDATGQVRITFDDTADGFISTYGWSPDSASIAFRENPVASSTNEIFVANADGSNAIRLSRDPAEPGRLTDLQQGTSIWSPNSERVAYTGEYDTDGLIGMYTARRNGTSPLQVSTKPLAFRGSARPEHAWSANSEAIAFVSEQEAQLTWDLFYVTEDGARTVKASVDVGSPGQVFGDFAWSPGP